MRLPGPLGALYRAIAPDEVEGPGFGRFEIGLILVIAAGLTTAQFLGSEYTFIDLFGDALQRDAVARLTAAGDLVGAELAQAGDHPLYRFANLTWWVACCVLGYMVLPALWLLINRRSIIDTGYLRPSGFTRHLKLYGALFALVMVAVVAVSFMPANQQIYPFYRQAGRSWFDLIAWELIYGLQFVALEFLFRGVMLEGLRRWLGHGAILVMLLPYCMLHFGKTSIESLAALIAGLALGSLAMKYRSIWGGVLLHWSIAMGMDVLSLVHQGKLPTRWWPDL